MVDLELVLKKIFLVRKLAVQAEKFLLLLVQSLKVCLVEQTRTGEELTTHADIELVLLVRIHIGILMRRIGLKDPV